MKLKMIRLKKLSFMTVAALGMAVMVIAIGSFFGVPKADAALSTNARNLAGLIVVSDVTGNGGGSLSGSDDLTDLIVLQGLFGTGTQAQKTQDLTGLIAVSNIVDDGAFNGGIGSSDTSLGDLIVLNNLFPTGTAANTRDLAGLIAVSNITDGGGIGGGDTDLGELLVLNNLFLDP